VGHGKAVGSRARCFAPSERKLGPPRDLRANHRKTTGPGTKKGAGASPLSFRTDPPKPESQSRLGIRPPREANLFAQRCFWKRANHVPAFAGKSTIEQTSESTGVSSLCTSQDRTNARFSLQIPTEEWRYESILWEATLPLHACDMVAVVHSLLEDCGQGPQSSKTAKTPQAHRTDEFLNYTVDGKETSRCSHTSPAIRSAKAT
jgi:hypothetical protein